MIQSDEDHAHQVGATVSKQEKFLLTKSKLMCLNLDGSAAAEEEGEDHEGEDSCNVQFRKVKLQALDMDWLFQDGNLKELITVLSECSVDSILTTKQLRLVVDLIWSYFQIAILKYILVPFMVYMFCSIYNIGVLITEFNEMIYADMTNEEEQEKYHFLRLKIYLVTTIQTLLLIFFASFECLQILDTGIWSYIGDYWNCVDLAQLIGNAILIILITITVAFENEMISIKFIRTVGAIVCFFLWIKMFYWARLFTNLAYYVKLIQDTFIESNYFIFMVMLIIISFATFFFVVDQNLKGKQIYTDFYGPE